MRGEQTERSSHSPSHLLLLHHPGPHHHNMSPLQEMAALRVSVPYLDLHIDENPQEYPINYFRARIFIDRVLSRRRSSLQRLRLRWYFLRSPLFLHTLIPTAIKQRLQELDIYVELENNRFEIPDRMVKLKSFVNAPPYYLPHSMLSAPNLRTLELGRFMLPKADSNREILFSCPVLETLVLFGCEYEHIEVINLCTDRLKKLVIENWEGKSDDGGCKLVLRTPNLSSFEYEGVNT